MIHTITGEVIHGEKLGRKLGFPTANIRYKGKDISDSVFHINIVLAGKVLRGMGSHMVSKGIFEAHIFDFDEDIYGQEIEVVLLQKIRDNRKFDSLEVLIQQIASDKEKIEKQKLITLTFGSFDVVHAGHEHYLHTAKKYGTHLIVIIATDSNIERIKGKIPQNPTKKRVQEITELGIADEVIPGSNNDPMIWLHQFRPFSICLGYDQRGRFVDILPKKLVELGLETEIVRIGSFHPEKYKSSLLKNI